jgi:hypothetical protein
MDAILPQALAEAIAAAQHNLTHYMNRNNEKVDLDPRVAAVSDADYASVAPLKVVVFIMLVQGTRFRFYRADFTGAVSHNTHACAILTAIKSPG